MIRRRCKLTRKGRITIPRDIRFALDIREGEEVEIKMHDDVVTITAIKPDAPPMVFGRPIEDKCYERIAARIAALNAQYRLRTP